MGLSDLDKLCAYFDYGMIRCQLGSCEQGLALLSQVEPLLVASLVKYGNSFMGYTHSHIQLFYAGSRKKCGDVTDLPAYVREAMANYEHPAEAKIAFQQLLSELMERATDD